MTQTRWSAKLKAAVLQEIDRGDCTEAEALEFYGLSAEELAGWRRAYETHGLRGLRATRLQFYRGVTKRFYH